MGAWRVQHWAVIEESAFSLFSVCANIRAGLETEDDGFPFSPLDCAYISAILGATSILVSAASLLKDTCPQLRLFEDKAFRTTTALKAFKIPMKLMLNFLMTTGQKNSAAYASLVASTFFSLALSAYLTSIKTGGRGLPDRLREKGVQRPDLLPRFYWLSWLCSKGGQAAIAFGGTVNLASVIFHSEDLVDMSSMMGSAGQSVSVARNAVSSPAIGFTAFTSLGLAAGSLLTNELSKLLGNPNSSYSATGSVDGVTSVAKFTAFCLCPSLLLTPFILTSCGWALRVGLVAVSALCLCSMALLSYERRHDDEP